jgi:tetraacyldisaccharide 4'-kinase
LHGRDGLPNWTKDIIPFAVTLEIDDAALLRAFIADHLFKAREKKYQMPVGI